MLGYIAGLEAEKKYLFDEAGVRHYHNVVLANTNYEMEGQNRECDPWNFSSDFEGVKKGRTLEGRVLFGRKLKGRKLTGRRLKSRKL